MLCFVEMWPAYQAHAKRYALIIGVSTYRYQPNKNNLPSPRKDAIRFQSLMNRLGFKTKTLLDSEATPENIREHLKWLQRMGQNPKHTLVFYYSGHGAQIPDTNGDEPDGKDETLFAYGADPKDPKQHIVDDELEAFTQSVRAKIFYVLDSCHSGTANKSLRGGKSKRLYISDQNEKEQAVAIKIMTAKKGSFFNRKGRKSIYGTNELLLSAARSNEPAQDMGNGSLLTNALLYVLENQGTNITFRQMYESINKYVAEVSLNMEKKRCKEDHSCRSQIEQVIEQKKREGFMLQHPQMQGLRRLKDSPVFFQPTESAPEHRTGLSSYQNLDVKIRGFREQAKKALVHILKNWGANPSDEKADTLIEHDGKELRVLFQGHLFVSLPATQKHAAKLMPSLKRVITTLYWLKNWKQLGPNSTEMRVELLARQTNAGWQKAIDDTVYIKTKIRIRILFPEHPCFFTLAVLSNQGTMDILFPQKNQSNYMSGKREFLFPSSGYSLRVHPPQGMGMIMAFCSMNNDRLITIRKRIRKKELLPPIPFPPGIKHALFSYFVK